MHVVLMNQFVPPDHAPTGILLHDLAETLRNRGHQVTVVSSEGRYGRATGIFSKLREYAVFYFCAYRTLKTLNPPPDVVVSMTTPPFIGLIAAHFKKRTGIPFILWCMDLYPEALAASGILKEKGFLYRLLARLTRSERTEADSIITLGPDMTKRMQAFSSAEEVPVWSNLQALPDAVRFAQELRRARGWADDELICLYSGNIGRAHRVDEFVELAKHLQGSMPRVRLVFCGGGPLRAQWEQQGKELFQWLEPVDEKDLAAHLLSADIHLISQQPEWVGVVVPSKYQAACALGRPVIFAGPPESAVARWIGESNAGWVLPPGDISAMKHVAQELSTSARVAEKIKRVAAGSFDREVLAGKLVKKIEQAVRER